MSSYRMKYKIGATQYHIPVTDDILGSGGGMVNTRVEITTSGTWTAPVDGWYRFIVKGAGGGGTIGNMPTYTFGGAGGGEGGTTLAFERLAAGDVATVVIGAGGPGGNRTGNTGTAGLNGGDSSVTVNGTTYTGGGGSGACNSPASCGHGGSGTIHGNPGGGLSYWVTNSSICGSPGGGAGGGAGLYTAPSAYYPNGKDGVKGGGGAGGSSLSGYTAGGNGGDGFVWIEFFDPTK